MRPSIGWSAETGRFNSSHSTRYTGMQLRLFLNFRFYSTGTTARRNAQMTRYNCACIAHDYELWSNLLHLPNKNIYAKYTEMGGGGREAYYKRRVWSAA